MKKYATINLHLRLTGCCSRRQNYQIVIIVDELRRSSTPASPVGDTNENGRAPPKWLLFQPPGPEEPTISNRPMPPCPHPTYPLHPPPHNKIYNNQPPQKIRNNYSHGNNNNYCYHHFLLLLLGGRRPPYHPRHARNNQHQQKHTTIKQSATIKRINRK